MNGQHVRVVVIMAHSTQAKMENYKKMEKEFVERELSQLMEVTLRLEDELNSIDHKYE